MGLRPYTESKMDACMILLQICGRQESPAARGEHIGMLVPGDPTLGRFSHFPYQIQESVAVEHKLISSQHLVQLPFQG